MLIFSREQKSFLSVFLRESSPDLKASAKNQEYRRWTSSISQRVRIVPSARSARDNFAQECTRSALLLSWNVYENRYLLPTPWNATPSATSHLPVPMTANRLYSDIPPVFSPDAKFRACCSVPWVSRARNDHISVEAPTRRRYQMRDGREQERWSESKDNRIFRKNFTVADTCIVTQKNGLTITAIFLDAKN